MRYFQEYYKHKKNVEIDKLKDFLQEIIEDHYFLFFDKVDNSSDCRIYKGNHNNINNIGFCYNDNTDDNNNSDNYNNNNDNNDNTNNDNTNNDNTNNDDNNNDSNNNSNSNRNEVL